MSERWVLVTQGWRNRLALHDPSADERFAEQMREAFDAAEGQRVESIRWCETHGRQEGFCNPTALELVHGFPMAADCEIVKATLILPAEQS